MRGAARLLPDGSVHLPSGQVAASVNEIPPGAVVYQDDGRPSTGYYMGALLGLAMMLGALWVVVALI